MFPRHRMNFEIQLVPIHHLAAESLTILAYCDFLRAVRLGDQNAYFEPAKPCGTAARIHRFLQRHEVGRMVIYKIC